MSSVRRVYKPMPQAAHIMVADEQAKEGQVSNDTTAVHLTVAEKYQQLQQLQQTEKARFEKENSAGKTQLMIDKERELATLQQEIENRRGAEREQISDAKLAKLFAKMEADAEAKASATATGGYKKKYTVKELKRIASRNNIKTTKKLDGKTVNLNKKGLMAKLKRKKLI
jgi:hypothetical protein